MQKYLQFEFILHLQSSHVFIGVMHQTDDLSSSEKVKSFQVICFGSCYFSLQEFPSLHFLPLKICMSLKPNSLFQIFIKYLNFHPLLDAVLGEIHWRKGDFSFSYDGNS